MVFCSLGKGTALDGHTRQLHLPNKGALPPLKLAMLLGKERIYFNSFGVKVVPYFQFLTLKCCFIWQMLSNLMLLFMEWPQKAKAMENGLSKIHHCHEERYFVWKLTLLSLSSNCRVVNQTMISLASLSCFGRRRWKLKQQRLIKVKFCASWGTAAAGLNLRLFYFSRRSDDSSPRQRLCLQRRIWPFFCTLFNSRRSVDLGKSPKAQLSPSKTNVNCWRNRSNRKTIKAETNTVCPIPCQTEPAKIRYSNAVKCARQ